MPVDITDIRSLVASQDDWRQRQTINLIASENVQSQAVRDIQNSDFMARYAEGHPNQGDQINRYYQGTQYIDRLETMAREELLALAGCRQADVRPISGNAANTAIALGYLRAGDPRHRQLDARRRPHQPQHHRRLSAGASRGAAPP